MTRRLAVFLAVSVALNLLFLGAMAGRRMHHGPPGPPPPASAEGFGTHGWRHGGLRRAFEGHRADAAGQRTALRGARVAVKDALLAEPFERVKLEAALLALRTETGKSQALLHQVLAEAAAGGTKEGRRELSESLEGERWRRFRK